MQITVQNGGQHHRTSYPHVVFTAPLLKSDCVTRLNSNCIVVPRQKVVFAYYVINAGAGTKQPPKKAYFFISGGYCFGEFRYFRLINWLSNWWPYKGKGKFSWQFAVSRMLTLQRLKIWLLIYDALISCYVFIRGYVFVRGYVFGWLSISIGNVSVVV